MNRLTFTTKVALMGLGCTWCTWGGAADQDGTGWSMSVWDATDFKLCHVWQFTGADDYNYYMSGPVRSFRDERKLWSSLLAELEKL